MDEEGEKGKETREEQNRDAQNRDLTQDQANTRASTKSPCVTILGMI